MHVGDISSTKCTEMDFLKEVSKTLLLLKTIYLKPSFNIYFRWSIYVPLYYLSHLLKASAREERWIVYEDWWCPTKAVAYWMTKLSCINVSAHPPLTPEQCWHLIVWASTQGRHKGALTSDQLLAVAQPHRCDFQRWRCTVFGRLVSRGYQLQCSLSKRTEDCGWNNSCTFPAAFIFFILCCINSWFNHHGSYWFLLWDSFVKFDLTCLFVAWLSKFLIGFKW